MDIEIILIIFGMFLLYAFIILIGLRWHKKTAVKKGNIQISNGFCPIGGVERSGAEIFFKEHPISNQIYKALLNHGKGNKFYDNEIDNILAIGAGALITSGAFSSNDVIVVVPNEAIIVFGDTGSTATGFGQLFCGKGIEIFYKQFKRNYIQKSIGSYTTITPAKKKSVIGNAVAGAVIAGGAGAVVGSIHAANHNSNTKDTVKTHYVYGNEIASQYFSFEYYMSKKAFEIDKMYVSSKIDLVLHPDLMGDAIKDIYNYKIS